MFPSFHGALGETVWPRAGSAAHGRLAAWLLGDFGPTPHLELFVVMIYGILLTILAGMLIRETRRRATEIRDRDLNLLASRILQQMRSLTGDVVAGLGQYASQIESVSRAMLDASAEDRPLLQQRLVELMRQMVSVNRTLQSRLSDAELELQQQRDQLKKHEYEARTDALTGLPNRRAFDEACARSLAHWQRYGRYFTLMLLDVDSFKQFNDRFGHLAGDTVLQAVADCLKGARTTDLVCRFGGEEFAILLTETELPDALIPAERMRQALARQAVMIDGTRHRVTVSIGVATVLPGESVTGLVERADAALYAAKEAGRNRTWYHDGERTRPVEVDLPESLESTPADETLPEVELASMASVAARCYPMNDASLSGSIAELEAVCRELRRQFDSKIEGAAASVN